MGLQLWGMLPDVDLRRLITIDPTTVEALTPDGLRADVATYVAADLYQLRLLLIQFPKGNDCFLKLNQVQTLRLSPLFSHRKKYDRGFRFFPRVFCDV